MKKNPHKFLFPILIVILLICGWMNINTSLVEELRCPSISNGILDLTEIPLEEGVIKVPHEWEFYPDRLYDPEDFLDSTESNAVDLPKHREEIERPWEIPYGTYRLKIKIPKNQILSMCGYSMDYSTRIFVNGELAVEAGKVSNNPKEAVPRINYCTVPVVADSDGTAEVVVQYSNFVHYEGGAISQFVLSTPTNIEKYKTIETLATNISCGGLFLLFAFYIIRFCVRREKSVFFFSLCCLIFALRNQRFYIVELIPWEYDWYLHYRLMVIFIMIQPWIIYMLLSSFYPKITKTIVDWLYSALMVVFILAIFLRPTLETAQISNCVYYVSVPCFIYMAICIIRHFARERKIGKQDVLIFTGLVILLLTMYIEVKWQRIIPEITRNGVTPLGMLVFVFFIMIVVDLRHDENQAKLIEASREKYMLETGARMRKDFLANISHEMLTPLTVISGYAQRTIIQLKGDKVGEDTYEGLLNISMEAQRLSILVEQMLDSPIDSSGSKIEKIQLSQISKRILALCNPILEKNSNRLEVCIDPQCADIAGNTEMLLQIILNLCINANRHTNHDIITLHMGRKDNGVIFTLKDHGDGIDENAIKNVFERGYSGDGKTGLGLSICRDIITYLGGEINIYSQINEGTRVVFWLPVWNEEVKYDNTIAN